MKKNIEDLNFQPFVSEAYKNNNGIYGKLLIIGESHYHDEDDIETDTEIEEQVEKEVASNEFTSAIVNGYIKGEWNLKFYRNLGLLFNENDKYEVWKNVAFANAIQVGLIKSTSQPTGEDIATVIPAFWSLLDNLKPDKVLICSKRMWNHWMPDSDNRSNHLKNVSLNEKYSASPQCGQL